MSLPYDLSKIGRIALTFLLVYCVAESAFIVSSIQYIGFFNEIASGLLSDAEMEAAATRVDTFGAFSGGFLLLVLVGCFIVVGMWLYRAAANAQAIKPDDARITPGWAVGWYFVPFANIVMPYRAMRQTWNGLTQNPVLDAGVPGYVLGWWILWILGNALSTISFRIFSDADSIQTYLLSSQLDVASSLISIIAAYLLRKLIQELTHASALASDTPPS